jgi:hypothetical protein
MQLILSAQSVHISIHIKPILSLISSQPEFFLITHTDGILNASYVL